MLFFVVNLWVYVTRFLLIVKFRRKVGYFPNVAFPKNYYDKMMWRKVFDRNPDFCVFSDKLATKEYARRLIPDCKIPETLWLGTSLDEEGRALLKNGVVLKSNHSCNHNIFIDEKALDFESLQEETQRWLRLTYGLKTGEWSYKGARKLIFIEKCLDVGNGQLVDVNIRAADGKFIVASCLTGNKTAAAKIGYFGEDGERLTEYDGLATPDRLLDSDFKVPEGFATCIEYARILGRGVDYARFDFMTGRDGIYMGEITVYPSGGFSRDRDAISRKYSRMISSQWDIGESYFFKTPSNIFLELYKSRLRKALA